MHHGLLKLQSQQKVVTMHTQVVLQELSCTTLDDGGSTFYIFGSAPSGQILRRSCFNRLLDTVPVCRLHLVPPLATTDGVTQTKAHLFVVRIAVAYLPNVAGDQISSLLLILHHHRQHAGYGDMLLIIYL
eukprot:3300196-Amphidinium_carterae.1